MSEETETDRGPKKIPSWAERDKLVALMYRSAGASTLLHRLSCMDPHNYADAVELHIAILETGVQYLQELGQEIVDA